ncbi:organic solute transporter Ostalpha-domain-containing protein [Trametes meyenii]|nr:organic solute transporter Ostalpha-domain-containing protein [Trametes meyenii]
MAEIVNGRCHAGRAPRDSPSLIQNGKLVLQAHHIGWIISSAFTVIAMGVSFWLIGKHIRWYNNKYEQRYIVRILFMVPLYAVISLSSYFWWNHSTPLLLIRDCYESTVLTAFFYLLLLYISPDPHVQKEIFRKNGLSREHDCRLRKRGQSAQKWMFPLGFIRWRPEDGLYFLQLMKWGVLQYCVIRPTTTLAAVVLDYAGLYCEDSWSPGWGHIYITLIVSISVTIAMYCLIQLYMSVKVELAPQKPLLKLFAIKAVVFLTFWQATFLSVLTLFGVVKDTPYMTADNINIGIGAIAETFEMACFALLHIKAFSYKPYYDPDSPTPPWRSLVHAMSFKETGRELWAGLVYMIHRSRGRETDPQARREAALEDLFGRSRIAIHREANASSSGKAKPSEKEQDTGVVVEVEREVHVNDERQWLGVGDDYVYGLGYQSKPRRERSDGLEEQIEKELVKRGYGLRSKRASRADYSPVVDAEAGADLGHQQRQTSWWRRVYNHISQSGPDPDTEHLFPSAPPSSFPNPPRRSSTRRYFKDVTTRTGTTPLIYDVQEDDYNDPPPPSAIRTYRESKNKRGGVKRKQPPVLEPPLLSASFADVPSPLSSPDVGGSRAPVAQYQPVSSQQPSPTWPAPATLAPTSSVSTPGTESVQADSFLERAFAASVEPSSSVEVLSTGPSSSQSHHTHIRLGPHPYIGTKMKRLPRTPDVVEPAVTVPSSSPTPAASPSLPPRSPNVGLSSVPPAAPAYPPPPLISPSPSAPVLWIRDESRRPARSSHRRDSALSQPRPSPPSSSQSPQRSPLPPSSPRLQRAAIAYSRGGLRRNSASAALQHPPANRFVPTRDRIVLPAPLALRGRESGGSTPSPPQQTFASSRYSPPGLPTSPPPQSRRWSTPYPPPNTRSPR